MFMGKATGSYSRVESLKSASHGQALSLLTKVRLASKSLQGTNTPALNEHLQIAAVKGLQYFLQVPTLKKTSLTVAKSSSVSCKDVFSGQSNPCEPFRVGHLKVPHSICILPSNLTLTKYIMLASYLWIQSLATYRLMCHSLIVSGITCKFQNSMKKCTRAKHSSLFCVTSVTKIKSFNLNNRQQCYDTLSFFIIDELKCLSKTEYTILTSYLWVRPFVTDRVGYHYVPQLICSVLTHKDSIGMKKCTRAKHSSLFCLASVMKIKVLTLTTGANVIILYPSSLMISESVCPQQSTSCSLLIYGYSHQQQVEFSPLYYALIGSHLTRKYSIGMKKCTSAKHPSLFCLASVTKKKVLTLTTGTNVIILYPSSLLMS